MEQRTAARLAWSLLGVVLAVAGAGLVLVSLNHPIADLIENSIFVAIFLAMGVVGAMIASRQHHNATGWIFLAIASCAGLAFAGSEYSTYALVTRPGSLPAAAWASLFAESMWVGILALSFTYLPLLFPDGRLPSPRWRPFAWTTGGFIGLVALVFLLDPGRIGPTRTLNPLGVEALRDVVRFVEGPGFGLLLILGLTSVTSLVIRFRRAAGAQRQQIKWFLFGAALLALQFVVDGIVQALGVRGGLLLDTILPAVAFTALPVGAGIAILRYRLYDIDVVINRTVLFGLLAAFITAIYVGIVIGIGSLVGGRGNLFLSIVATAVVAVAFQPIRSRARHFANRLVYGKRATPYEVLSTFSDHLGEAYSTEDILPRIARMIGEATGAERARVWVRVGSELRAAAAWPDGGDVAARLEVNGTELPAFPGDERPYPVQHQGELLGALSLETSRREPLNPTQEKLVTDLAGQAGLILRNVRLIEELRASRQRLVAAQDEERRRLERNIHDGAQQQLVALAVKIRLARTMTDRDVEKAQSLLDELQGETQDALENLRDLARGVYPPLLADKGLSAALEAQARKVPFPVRVEPNGVGRYTAEAEATAYFCVLEALQNAAKYAEASSATVRLGQEDRHLVFSVADDGRGFDPATTPPGSGLQNMTDRLEALGGTLEVASTPGRGTSVTGRIPILTGASR
jgi:signal transduction histidine kinase